MLKCEVISNENAETCNVKIVAEGSILDIAAEVLKVIQDIYGGLNESAAEEFQRYIRTGTHILSPVWKRKNDG